MAEFGANYIESATLNGQSIFRNEIRSHVASRLAGSDHGFSRPIDTLVLDHLSSIICKEDVFRKYFSAAIHHGFPDGKEHLRLVFSRLVPIRNALSHANPISLHDAERALCYCSDIIASLTEYYARLGMSQKFDAPSFTRYSDSVGRVKHPTGTDEQLNFTAETAFRAGQSIRLEVDVDAHYPPDDYVVTWKVVNIPNAERGEGNQFVLTLLPRQFTRCHPLVALFSLPGRWRVGKLAVE